jgi:cytochrome b involved in lipid metabolism
MPNYTRDEVTSNASKGWIIVNSKVYAVADFVNDHPGGPELIEEEYGS